MQKSYKIRKIAPDNYIKLFKILELTNEGPKTCMSLGLLHFNQQTTHKARYPGLLFFSITVEYCQMFDKKRSPNGSFYITKLL